MGFTCRWLKQWRYGLPQEAISSLKFKWVPENQLVGEESFSGGIIMFRNLSRSISSVYLQDLWTYHGEHLNHLWPLLHPSFPGDSEGDMAKAGGEWPRCENPEIPLETSEWWHLAGRNMSLIPSESMLHQVKKTKRIDPKKRMVLYCSTCSFFPGKTAAFSRLIWGSLTRGGHHGVASRTVTAPQHDDMTRIVFCFALVLLLQFSAGVGQRNNKLTKFVSVYFVLVCIPANSTFIHWSDML